MGRREAIASLYFLSCTRLKRRSNVTTICTLKSANGTQKWICFPLILYYKENVTVTTVYIEYTD